MSAIQEEIKSLLGPNVLKSDWLKLAEMAAKPGKPEDVHHQLDLPLEKLYTGMSVRIRADKKIPCKDCSKGANKLQCAICRGTGRSGLNLTNVCPVCKGQGVSNLPCIACKGQGKVQEEKYYTVKVPPGAQHGTQIRLMGEGDSLLDQPQAPSDIVCTVKEQPHADFRRCRHDLYLLKDISITEAICGLKMVLKHLDGRKIVLRTKPGKVIKTGDMLYAKNEGMPVMNSKTAAKGDLIVMFNVLFPDKFEDVSIIEQLESFLPKRPSNDIAGKDLEDFHLTKFDPKEQVYHVPFRGREYHEDSPAKNKTDQKKEEEKIPTCAQQ